MKSICFKPNTLLLRLWFWMTNHSTVFINWPIRVLIFQDSWGLSVVMWWLLVTGLWINLVCSTHQHCHCLRWVTTNQNYSMLDWKPPKDKVYHNHISGVSRQFWLLCSSLIISLITISVSSHVFISCIPLLFTSNWQGHSLFITTNIATVLHTNINTINACKTIQFLWQGWCLQS